MKSITMFFSATMFLNFANYGFNLFLGRALGPEEFGILSSLMSVLVIVAIPAGALQTLLAKNSIGIKSESGLSGLRVFVIFILKITGFAGAVFLVFTILCGSGLMAFLNISNKEYAYLVAIMWLPNLITPVLRGVLQGVERFKSLSVLIIIEAILKVSIGVGLVLAGFGVAGVLIAIIISSSLILVYNLFLVKFLFERKKVKRPDFKRFLLPIIPIFIAGLFFNLFYSLDVVLVKHYLSAVDAGLYAALSKMGLIIFFAAGPISGVLLPMSSRKHLNGKDTKKILFQTIGIILSIAGIALVVYVFASKLFVSFMFGSSYLSVHHLLKWSGLLMTILSLNFLLMNYLISVHRFNFIWVLGVAALTQIMSIIYLHNNIKQIILNLAIVWGVTFLGMLFLALKVSPKKEISYASLNTDSGLQRGT